ncbi:MULTISPECIES: hypothetical protein [unclassified Paraburkholderia]|uniref:hypothetical protein n=1 Tax=unclassified Paraburkholderia TaxID=2615204 RepID=UPI002AB30F64|nr:MULTISPECIES: hypothetical protein [unclassified Paraburkholderia]
MFSLRRFLLRGGTASRVLFLAAFAILLARALLPGAVMLDPDPGAQGGFALVMCSGHGPMFAKNSGVMPDMADMMPDMDMSHMAGMMHDGISMHGSAAHDTMAGDNSVCPFSAALVVACVSIALAVVLFTLTRVTQLWSASLARPLVRISLHFRPLSRAPPLFG